MPRTITSLPAWRRLLGLILLCCVLVEGSAQKVKVELKGGVYGKQVWQAGSSTTKALQGATVEVLLNNKVQSSLTADEKGRIKVPLDYNRNYSLRFRKDGWVSKKIRVDTRNIGREEQAAGDFRIPFDITLFPVHDELDLSYVRKTPMGEFLYDQESRDLQYNEVEAKLVSDSVDRLIIYGRQLNAARKWIAKGDDAMSSEQFQQAENMYTKALVEVKHHEEARGKRVEARFSRHVEEGDGHFVKAARRDSNLLKISRSSYQHALAEKAMAAHPTTRITEIEYILDSLRSPSPPPPPPVVDTVVPIVVDNPPVTEPIRVSEPERPLVNLDEPDPIPEVLVVEAPPITRPDPKRPTRTPSEFADLSPAERLALNQQHKKVNNQGLTPAERYALLKQEQARLQADRERWLAQAQARRNDGAGQIAVTQETLTPTVEERQSVEDGKTILSRQVTFNGRTQHYRKVEARYGTFYFKGETSISASQWRAETGGG